MSEVVRLSLVSHAMTDALAAGRFPADEPLNELGHRQTGTVDISASGTGQIGASGTGQIGASGTVLCGPEKRTVQTAELLGLSAEVRPELADLDCGGWRGKPLGAVEPADLAVWLTEPTRAPHGGESIVELIERVRRWMQTVSTRRGRLVAVTHPAVIRAAVLVALDAPPKSFWRIDIAPVSRTVLHHRAGAWTLRSG
ncbi:histidine phosphatase family protein [Mycolicibacterium goodii]|uniref:Histidine phosphatase n=1 Tax=Mycolicibacterium goodii TaxID=134601 RepID=A0A0K0X410_MYCGD|nr:histidine phosphatase [Mycolicibacterium goodii]